MKELVPDLMVVILKIAKLGLSLEFVDELRNCLIGLLDHLPENMPLVGLIGFHLELFVKFSQCPDVHVPSGREGQIERLMNILDSLTS